MAALAGCRATHPARTDSVRSDWLPGRPWHPTRRRGAKRRAVLVQAALVPGFPRIGGQPVRDWIGATVDNMEGFNGDDLTRLLLPDLRGLTSGAAGLLERALLASPGTTVIALTLGVAFVYWEGGVLLRQARAAQRRRDVERQRQQDGGGEGAADGGGPLQEGHHDHEHHEHLHRAGWTSLDKARHERRRGLGYLALGTAVLVWLCGVVNNPTPFQP